MLRITTNCFAFKKDSGEGSGAWSDCVKKTNFGASNYNSLIDPNKCKGCGACIERCHMKAISEQNGISTVDLKKCIGCGLCVTGCKFEAVKLKLKPKNEIIDPPKDFTTWENERLVNRGLKSQ